MNAMKTILSSTIIAILVSAAGIARAEPTAEAPTDDEARPAAENAPAPDKRAEEERVPVSIGFLYPLATNANRANVTTNADLSVLYGRVGLVEGAQVGGVIVHASRGVDGAQIGGVSSITGGSVTGLQLTGVANVALEGVTGAQIGGAFNLSGGRSVGAQVAGVVNVAEEHTGLQLGVVNVGRRVHGLQLGVVNVAEEADAAIGLVSISKDSIHPIAWTSNLQYSNVGVKFTSKYLFTMLGVHYGTHENGFDDVGATMAIGGHVPLPASFDVEVQGSLTHVVPWNQWSDDKENTWIAPQVVGGYSFAKHLRVFAGGGVRLPITVHTGRDVSRPELLAGIQF